MKSCPYCGSDEGYCMYERVHRYLFFNFYNEPINASEDVADYSGTRKYCLNCHKTLPKKLFEENIPHANRSRGCVEENGKV